ncbi:Aste57867_21 [Aphanomyces stellatus]|uniref:Aste57867_21 protein n=1 Tax=Aphanomyces stellatus TaxID=120398 RepID=A0A485K4K0_9STRA|nr:hypothetical protein As57867_000021 [Aphanomyces stellatus]VFT77247.1 Aste57867_21 [Aphanomyces stellatus]
MAAASSVLHSRALFLVVRGYQNGACQVIQALLHCPTISCIHGRLVVRDEFETILPCDGCKLSHIDIHMDALPAFMERRHQLMASVLETPRATVDLHEMLATHIHLRDVVAEYAAFHGDMELMTLLCETATKELPWIAVHVDATTGQEFVRACASNLLHLAAFNGHDDIMALLSTTDHARMRHGAFTSYSDLEVAGERGHLRCVQCVLDDLDPPIDTYWGLRQGDHTSDRHCQHLNVLDVVAENGHVEIATVLFRYGAPYSEAAIDNAASRGHLGMVQFFHDKPSSKCTTEAMDGAAANGHIEVVQFLHNHRKEGCTTDALDAAAHHGHHAIVEFLLDKRTEGGTVKAMNEYVARGDLTMVKLTDPGKCSSGSVNIATSHGHLEIVKYLVGDKQTTFAAPAIEAAVKHGHVAVVEYLHGQRPEMCVAKYMQVAHICNQSTIVEYFDGHRCKCCKDIPRDELITAKPAKKRRRKN